MTATSPCSETSGRFQADIFQRFPTCINAKNHCIICVNPLSHKLFCRTGTQISGSGFSHPKLLGLRLLNPGLQSWFYLLVFNKLEDVV